MLVSNYNKLSSIVINKNSESTCTKASLFLLVYTPEEQKVFSQTPLGSDKEQGYGAGLQEHFVDCIAASGPVFHLITME